MRERVAGFSGGLEGAEDADLCAGAIAVGARLVVGDFAGRKRGGRSGAEDQRGEETTAQTDSSWSASMDEAGGGRTYLRR